MLPDPALIKKYGGPVPRYTSYPTAPHFSPETTPPIVAQWQNTLPTPTASLYLHLPFCKSLCLYCGCNMKVTNNPQVISSYVDVLKREITQTASALPRKLAVSTLHLGGGTPSYCPAPAMLSLFETLHHHFAISHQAEISMEIDPRRLDDTVIAILRQIGLNRASLGIQDTNPAVQQAIRREQPHSLNLRAVQALRHAGIHGINVDLIYGLPLQTVATIKQTVADVLQLTPQRIALFGYAHVPWMKKHQQVLEPYGLPDADQRLILFETAAEALTAAGYLQVGIDHFCRPEDPMAQAAQAGTLNRNFMGYTTDANPTLLGFGASAISQYPQGYAQNITDIPTYITAVNQGLPPIARGIAISAEDLLRREIITDLLCHMKVNIGAKLAANNQQADVLGTSMGKLGVAIIDGLVQLEADGHTLSITQSGKPFARAIAACFDTYLKQQPGQHSRAV